MQTLYRHGPGRLFWLQMRDHGTGSAALLSGTVGNRAAAVVRGPYTDIAIALDRRRAEGFREYGAADMVGLIADDLHGGEFSGFSDIRLYPPERFGAA
jgi:hypothetical protein